MSRRDALLTALLIVAAVGLHVAAGYRLDYVPPDRLFEFVVVGLPVLGGVVAVVALAVRAERRPLQAACLLQWLLVLYTLPASFAGIAFVPSAVALSVAVSRTATSSRAREA